MNTDFRLIRENDKLEALKREESQLRFGLTKTKRDAEAELSRIKREYDNRISSAEQRLEVLETEIRNKQLAYNKLKEDIEREQRIAEDERRRKAEEEKRRRLQL